MQDADEPAGGRVDPGNLPPRQAGRVGDPDHAVGHGKHRGLLPEPGAERHLAGPQVDPDELEVRVAVRPEPDHRPHRLAVLGQAMWAVIGFRPNSNPYFQLVRIDLRTGKVTLRTRLGQQPAVLAVADGVIWITNPAGLARRQIARIDPATGRFVGVLHLDAGPCGYLTVSLGQLWAECGSGPWNTVFLRLSPVTGQVLERLGPVRGPIGNQIAITPQGVWYYTNYSGLSGILRDGGRAHVVTAQDLRYPVGFAFTRSLVYSQGALWVLTGA